MNKNHIEILKGILSQWNPFGNKASQISDLNNYETEATDILFHINNRYSVDQISKIIISVLEQAFDIFVDSEKSHSVAKEIHSIINKK